MSEPEVDMLDTIILANPSDLRLIVGPGRQSIDVSRSALGLASPVWNRMIFGPWAEGWKKEIEFPDDDPEAVLIVLGIAHLKFKDRPKKLTYDQLVDLAIVCDKYDTVGVVRPFLTEWIGDLKMHVQPGKEEWIFYAWTFGYTTDFFVAVQTLVRESTTDADGCLLHGNKPLGGRFPPDLLDCISEARRKSISQLLRIPTLHLEKYVSDDACTLYMHSVQFSSVGGLHPVPDARKCLANMAGHLLKALHGLKLWPNQPDASSYQSSVLDLYTQLSSISIPEYNGTHGACVGRAGLRADIVKAYANSCLGFKDYHLKHMATQWAK